MDASDKRVLPPTPASTSFALGLLTAFVYVAGFAVVAAWFALLILGQPGTPAAPTDAELQQWLDGRPNDA